MSSLISLFSACTTSILVIPTEGRDLIGTAVGLPLFSHDYYFVILEGSILITDNLLGRKSTMLPFSLPASPAIVPIAIGTSLRSGGQG
jgi:hypothetical protein